MLSDDEMAKILQAGRIGAEARELGASLVRPGASAREICEEVENLIIKRGARPAFPCNFSVNEVAAHYTPGIDDDIRVPEKAVVKVDVGASVDGYLSDTAVTVAIGSPELERLASSAREALEAAARIMTSNVRIYDIGKAIETTIKSMGFRPVKNLTGHTIARYTLHAGDSIPNYADRSTFYRRLGPGTMVAVEPFSTTGRGLVIDGPKAYIYSATGRMPRGLSEEALELYKFIVQHYSTLPFALRWLQAEWGRQGLERAVAELIRAKALYKYPILIEASGSPVAQFEHTFLILKDRTVITTLKAGP